MRNRGSHRKGIQSTFVLSGKASGRRKHQSQGPKVTRQKELQAEGATSIVPEARGSLAGLGKRKKSGWLEHGKQDMGLARRGGQSPKHVCAALRLPFILRETGRVEAEHKGVILQNHILWGSDWLQCGNGLAGQDPHGRQGQGHSEKRWWSPTRKWGQGRCCEKKMMYLPSLPPFLTSRGK